MENNSVKITVITVSYNAALTIEESILSVIKQTYRNIEYIIIDGNSNDGTVDIIKKYAKNIAYWVSEPDSGIYDAMNKGLSVATGHYVYFLGADDVIADNGVFSRIASEMENDTSIIYYSNVKFKHSGIIYPGIIKSNYRICLDNFSHQAIFYPLKIYSHKKYNINYRLWADYVYNIELYADKKNKFKYVDDIIAIFNCDGRGSVQRDKLFDENRINLIRSLFGYKLAFIIFLRINLGRIYKQIINKFYK